MQGAGVSKAPARLPREVWSLITANAIIALGYGVVAPVLPQLARHFGVSISAATFVITAFAVMRLLAAPPTGLLVQRLGERKIYVGGVVVVAVSTAACAFAQTYWQLLAFRALGGIGSTMFFVSALGLMIRMSPPDARGRVAGMFSGAFLVGSVAGTVLGSLTAGLGLSAPFIIYGVLLLFAAAIVLVSLRHSPLAAPATGDEPVVSLRDVLGNGAYRAALLSNFATGWSLFGLRFALVPLFVVEGLDRGPAVAGLALTAFAVGNVIAVMPSGRLSDRIGRRPLLITGLALTGIATATLGLAPSLPVFLAEAVVAGLASGGLQLPAAGRGGRHHRPGPGRPRDRDVPDDVGFRLDRGIARGRADRQPVVVRVGVRHQRGHFGPGVDRVDVRPRDPRGFARRAHAGAGAGAGGGGGVALTAFGAAAVVV